MIRADEQHQIGEKSCKQENKGKYIWSEITPTSYNYDGEKCDHDYKHQRARIERKAQSIHKELVQRECHLKRPDGDEPVNEKNDQ